jgi:hypothetical protein
MDTQFHVPCCPRCYIPLHAAEEDDTKGACPSIHCRNNGNPYTSDEWVWLHQDTFSGDDLPPYDGWLPVNVGAL